MASFVIKCCLQFIKLAHYVTKVLIWVLKDRSEGDSHLYTLGVSKCMCAGSSMGFFTFTFISIENDQGKEQANPELGVKCAVMLMLAWGRRSVFSLLVHYAQFAEVITVVGSCPTL